MGKFMKKTTIFIFTVMFSLLCTACKADDNSMFLGENKDFL